MGAIQTPTPEMGPYRVELRRESFILTRVDASPDMRVSEHEAVIPLTDYSHIGPAFDQALSQVDRWEAAGKPSPTDLSWTADENGRQAPATWEMECPHDQLRIRGPWVVGYERDLWHVELCYADAPAFLHAFYAAAMA